MAKTDWNLHDTVQPQDMNALGSEINSQGTEISMLEDRLNIAEYEDITLQPGLQVINAKRDSRFRLGEIKGRTLINLLSWGGCESLQSWPNDGRFSLDTTSKVEGNSSIKVTISQGDPYADLYQRVEYDPGKCYVAVGALKVPSGIQARIRVAELGKEITSEIIQSSTGDKFKTVFFRVPRNAVPGATAVYFGAVFVGPSGYAGNADALRIYEISSSEYAALDGMTPEQVAAKYPYISTGMIGVDNPYAIRYGENLLPPFYEWRNANTEGRSKITGPYSLETQGEQGAGFWFEVDIPAVEKETYSLSGENSESNKLYAIAINEAKIAVVPDYLMNTFTTPSGTKYLRVYVNTDTSPNVVKFNNPMLVIGSNSKPFKPRWDTMLAFHTELHASPVDGSDPDVLFEKEGQYFRLAKWGKKTLNNFSGWLSAQARPGYKVFACPLPNAKTYSQTVVKYNGAPLKNTLPDNWISGDLAIVFDNYLYLSVSNSDSGWGEADAVYEFNGDGSTVKFMLPAPPTGLWVMSETVTARVDNTPVSVTSVNEREFTVAAAPASGKKLVVNYKISYVPIEDEIKAYFNGWVMTSQETWNTTYEQYSGIGTKGWLKRYVGIGTPITTSKIGVFEAGSGNSGYILPTTVINSRWTPYQILYRLAKETVEPVVSEGCLTLLEGDNLVEVSTGIVLREKANPSNVSNQNLWAVINHKPTLSSKLNFSVDSFITVYNENQKTNDFRHMKTDVYSFGKEYLDRPWTEFDQNATYSVTYLKLDKSPIQPFTGTLATNENAQISDLTAGVAEALLRVSVVEQKKAEKDSPGWITPTLLNGAGQGSDPVRYKKNTNSMVVVTGIFVAKAVSTVFKLPVGYRPANVCRFITLSSNVGQIVPAYVDVYPNGNVNVANFGPDYVSFEGVMFLVE
ncbi:hypothetical protein DFP94_101181 [Fontibacillus phaseoli]|uniref:Carbohydrate binding protein n=1 Tax=Fontibacillus phaseoli TaxID=1416533 RepID=A0A369BMH5_9BACL|nr:hypothetical protein [Fontibacillus phaseoli]RCX22601.1 hypothetical protein DFP94_101181 [Fontibacillus phaseoli]